MQNLLQYISTRCFVDAQLKARIETDFEYIELTQGAHILKQDQHCRKLYFIDKGVIHNYYYHNDRMITSWFYAEKQFVTAWYSFYAQKGSFEEMQCLEDCTVYAISFDKYQKLIADSPAFGNFARLLAEEALAFLDYFSKGWSFLSAKEQYNQLQQYFPGIEQRVKLGHIASFLGITQETLSRIRR
ncbi:MAG: Crp/Fnr family transcriptional regulator [Bacteroidales bacterium]|nr:Crp/Fnr family transcriptional regulator [Bacteroidales bacterium]